uniref:NADH-ubiquinone oxidoreductase chain 3 n=1 Tax=Dictyopteris divaricata TaxID=156996 RepID=A0A4Y5T7V9_9PHAE|nr:NADH dehydrogenase subunit 3 [Dictyopteris divaricata]QDB64145.1 NADH dehydrogenase subunit 3 [Dictyopteris divaricata]
MFYLHEYYSILIFLVISVLLAFIIFGASYLLALSNSDSEKLSSYECGFDPYEDARNAFDVRFYLVAILFLLFDIETVFVFPWAISLSQMPSIGYWSMMDFLFELVVGFIYAWKIGSLEWS